MHRTRNLLPLAAITGLCAVGCLKPDGAKKTLPGHELYAACASCHGQNAEGNAKLAAPAIAGLPTWYLEAQLVKFRSGHRAYHPDDVAGLRMRPMSRQMMDMGEVKAVSAHVAGLPAQKPSPTLGGDAAAGAASYATCLACHGAKGEGNQALNAPPIAQMPDWYLLTQLKNFKAGIRGTHPEDKSGQSMRPMSMTLADEQAMKNVIAHIETLGR
jgi:cytochrome c oxidase subunit 2